MARLRAGHARPLQSGYYKVKGIKNPTTGGGGKIHFKVTLLLNRNSIFKPLLGFRGLVGLCRCIIYTSIHTIIIGNRFQRTISTCSCFKSSLIKVNYFCEVFDASDMLDTLSCNIFPLNSSQVFTGPCLTISLRQFRLNSHSNHASFSDNLLLVGLVNVASQSRNQQGGQDSQNDQNDDQFNEGEALFYPSVS